jgi:hypothetical protein
MEVKLLPPQDLMQDDGNIAEPVVATFRGVVTGGAVCRVALFAVNRLLHVCLDVGGRQAWYTSLAGAASDPDWQALGPHIATLLRVVWKVGLDAEMESVLLAQLPGVQALNTFLYKVAQLERDSSCARVRCAALRGALRDVVAAGLANPSQTHVPWFPRGGTCATQAALSDVHLSWVLLQHGCKPQAQLRYTRVSYTNALVMAAAVLAGADLRRRVWNDTGYVSTWHTAETQDDSVLELDALERAWPRQPQAQSGWSPSRQAWAWAGPADNRNCSRSGWGFVGSPG